MVNPVLRPGGRFLGGTIAFGLLLWVSAKGSCVACTRDGLLFAEFGYMLILSIPGHPIFIYHRSDHLWPKQDYYVFSWCFFFHTISWLIADLDEVLLPWSNKLAICTNLFS
jgi:hypothetical protein